MVLDHPWFARNPSYPYVRTSLMPVSWEGNLACLLFLLMAIGIVWKFGRTSATLALLVILGGIFMLLERWAS